MPTPTPRKRRGNRGSGGPDHVLVANGEPNKVTYRSLASDDRSELFHVLGILEAPHIDLSPSTPTPILHQLW